MDMEIKSWEDYFLDLAKTCASRSNCIRAQVGAVIVGQDKKIKATGYNGTPSKVESCYERGECYRMKNNVSSAQYIKTILGNILLKWYRAVWNWNTERIFHRWYIHRRWGYIICFLVEFGRNYTRFFTRHWNHHIIIWILKTCILSTETE